MITVPTSPLISKMIKTDQQLTRISINLKSKKSQIATTRAKLSKKWTKTS